MQEFGVDDNFDKEIANLADEAPHQRASAAGSLAVSGSIHALSQASDGEMGFGAENGEMQSGPANVLKEGARMWHAERTSSCVLLG